MLPLPALNHVPQRRPRTAHRRADVHLHHPRPFLVGGFQNTAAMSHAGIIDQDVEPAERGHASRRSTDRGTQDRGCLRRRIAHRDAAASSAPAARLRPVSINWAPQAAKCSAMARPIPEVAPVINAVKSVSAFRTPSPHGACSTPPPLYGTDACLTACFRAAAPEARASLDRPPSERRCGPRRPPHAAAAIFPCRYTLWYAASLLWVRSILLGQRPRCCDGSRTTRSNSPAGNGRLKW